MNPVINQSLNYAPFRVNYISSLIIENGSFAFVFSDYCVLIK